MNHDKASDMSGLWNNFDHAPQGWRDLFNAGVSGNTSEHLPAVSALTQPLHAFHAPQMSGPPSNFNFNGSINFDPHRYTWHQPSHPYSQRHDVGFQPSPLPQSRQQHSRSHNPPSHWIDPTGNIYNPRATTARTSYMTPQNQPDTAESISYNSFLQPPQDLQHTSAGDQPHTSGPNTNVAASALQNSYYLPEPYPLNPTSATPYLQPKADSPRVETNTRKPPGKKRRLQPDVSQTEARSDEASEPHRVALPSYLDPETVAICSLWRCRNPTRRISINSQNFLSGLCQENVESICRLFKTIDGDTQPNDCQRNEVRQPDHQVPHPLTEAACGIWLKRNSGRQHSAMDIAGFCYLFNESRDDISNWFIRNSSSSHLLDDSGIGTMTGTRTEHDQQIISKFRRNRKQCLNDGKGKGKNKIAARLRRADLEKDPDKPYPCVTCGHNFDDKNTWKRHYSNNRIQVLWLCEYGECQNRQESDRVWSRKQQFHNHVKNHHYEHVNDIERSGRKIEANFRSICIFRSCSKRFSDFDESCRHMCGHFKRENWRGSDLRDEDNEAEILDDSWPSKEDDENQEPSDEDSSDDSDGHDDGNDPSSPHANPSGSSKQGNQEKQLPGAGSKRQSADGSGSGASYEAQVQYQADSDSAIQLRASSLSYITFISGTETLRATHIVSLEEIAMLMAPWSPKLDFLGRLGSSSRAVIDEVRFRGHSWTMACKSYGDLPDNAQQKILRETEIMARLRHPHIVELITGYEESNSLAILMKPVANYNLAQYLTTCSVAYGQQRDMWPWFHCLISGLQHIHERGVRHKDIKPSNILIKDSNILISDFGSSDLIVNDERSKLQSLEYTKLYAAPEVLRGERGTASDVFSLGCVFLEMATSLLSRHKWKEMRLLQRQCHNEGLHGLHWATTWTDTLYEHLSYSVNETNAQLLLYVCRIMTNPQPERRPSAAKVEEKFNPRLRDCCLRIHPVARGVRRKSSTWPLNARELRTLSDSEDPFGESSRKATFGDGDRISETSEALEHIEISSPRNGDAALQISAQHSTALRTPTQNNDAENMMPLYLQEPNRYEQFVVLGETVSSEQFNGTTDLHLAAIETTKAGHIKISRSSCFASSNRANTVQPEGCIETPLILQHVMFSHSQIVIPLGNVSLDGSRTSTKAKIQQNSRSINTKRFGRKSSCAYW